MSASDAPPAVHASELVELIARFDIGDSDVETVLASLNDIIPSGYRYDDAQLPVLELGVYVAGSQADATRAAITAAFPDATFEREAVPDDYAERWKAHHVGSIVGRLWVGPPWEDTPTNVPSVTIDPGQGFGTGSHATTRLVLELMQRSALPARVVDLGCGSAVLSIAARVLGARDVYAYDIDDAALDAARGNVERNGTQLRELAYRDVLNSRLPEADLYLANLILDPLLQLAARIERGSLAPPPRIIVSGLLVSQAQRAAEAFDRAGYVVQEDIRRDGWAALDLRHRSVEPELAP